MHQRERVDAPAGVPSPRSAAVDRPVVPDDAGGAHEQLGDVGGASRSASPNPSPSSKSTMATPSAGARRGGRSAAVRDACVVQGARPGSQRSSSTASVTDGGIDVAQPSALDRAGSRAARHSARRCRRRRPAGPAPRPARRAGVTYASCSTSSSRVRCMLGPPSLYTTSARPSPRNCASASSRPSTRSSKGPSRRSAIMIVPCGAADRRADAGAAERRAPRAPPATCAVVGRPPGEPKTRCTAAAIPQPSTTPANAASGQRRPEVERGDRHGAGRGADRAGGSGRVRYGDATAITATMTASRTTGNDGDRVTDAGHDLQPVTIARVPDDDTPMKPARAPMRAPRRSPCPRASRQRRATSAATTTRPTAHSAPNR